MSQEFRRTAQWGAICQTCGHDLETHRNGQVYCTNHVCIHHEQSHPTGPQINTIGGAPA